MWRCPGPGGDRALGGQCGGWWRGAGFPRGCVGRGRVSGDRRAGIRRGGWGPLDWSRALQLTLCVPAWGPGPTTLRPQGQRLDTGLLVQVVEPEPPKCGPGIQLPACPGAFCVQGSVDGARYRAGAPDLSPHRVPDGAAPPRSRGQHRSGQGSLRPPSRPLWGPPSQMCLPGPLPGLLCG